MDEFVMGDGTAQALPDGTYYAVWRGMEPVPEKVVDGETWKPGWEFKFEITTGPHKGAKKAMICRNPVPTERNNLGRAVSGLLGRMPKPGEPIRLSPHLGASYLLVIQGGKIASISAPPQP